MKLRPWVKIVLLIIAVGLVVKFVPKIYNYFKDTKIVSEIKEKLPSSKKKEEERKKEEVYQACLIKAYDESELNEELRNEISNLDNYILNNYRMSVRYEDEKTGFSYAYKPEQVFYAASTIKLLDALYIYNKAAEGSLDLNETVTIKQKYPVSKGMDNHQVGEEIDLRTLVKYAIIYSDNTAHQMLVSYIGFSNLKAYGNSLGATNTLIGGDNFGNISADDALIYLKKTNEFIENNQELGKELKGYMLEAEENALKYEGLNVPVGHKYGEYDVYFNDIGIVYDEHPYLIAILTTHGKGNYIEVVSDISHKINDLHQHFKQLRESECQKIKEQ